MPLTLELAPGRRTGWSGQLGVENDQITGICWLDGGQRGACFVHQYIPRGVAPYSLLLSFDLERYGGGAGRGLAVSRPSKGALCFHEVLASSERRDRPVSGSGLRRLGTADDGLGNARGREHFCSDDGSRRIHYSG